MTRVKHGWLSLLAILIAFAVVAVADTTSKSWVDDECLLFSTRERTCDLAVPQTFLPYGISRKKEIKSQAPGLTHLTEVLKAISVMQNEYYSAWLGTWPDSIDWTGAVIGTHMAGAAKSFSEALALINTSWHGVEDWRLKENLIEDYFSHIVGYYFGQDAFAIRGEAFDDILWVVLGWIEAIQFINTHTELYFKLRTQAMESRLKDADAELEGDMTAILSNQTWHGNLWAPAFSHRARIFWDLSTNGWDTELCGGGMDWNPRLLPYKNAITNELFIAASISMYLYHPGDDNTSPFYNRAGTLDPEDPEVKSYVGPRDPKFLKAAVDGYKWLVNSGMTDSQGLYTDGFHISGYTDPSNNNTLCDERNNMVFTYNQGVLLTGQRGLWEATGATSYLEQGHTLIQNTIKATGYDLVHDQPLEDVSVMAMNNQLPQWYGLGRAGVMEDQCDASGTCSQDSQTFKGIFFHHLTAFCTPLPAPTPELFTYVNMTAFTDIKMAHEEACSHYSGWLKLNTDAALGTLDKDGKFGAWWTAGLLTNFTATWPTTFNDGINRDRDVAGVDYRSYGVPNDTGWQNPSEFLTGSGPKIPIIIPNVGSDDTQTRMGELRRRQVSPPSDPNSRGRGRTVETQGSGLALLRAYWNIAHAP